MAPVWPEPNELGIRAMKDRNLGLEEAHYDGLDEGRNTAIKVDEANAVAPAKDIGCIS